MIRIAVVLACLYAATAVAEPLQPPAVVDQATVDSLATTYTFDVVGAPTGGCIVKLEATPTESDGRIGRPVTIDAQCRDRFPPLRLISRWEPTGGASIRLLGDAPLRELSNLSPVQDATGVYLRGGFAGDPTLYELRPPQ